MMNPRLTKSKEEFVKIMKELNLPYPKQIGEKHVSVGNKLQSALDRKDTSHYYRQLLWHHYNNHHSVYMYCIYNLLLVPLCLLQTNRWKHLLFYLSKVYCDIHVTFSVVSPHSIFLPFHLKLSTRLWQ